MIWPRLLEAMKQTGAPEACTAGNGLYIAILLEVSLTDIVAEREATVKTERECIPEHTLPERAGVRVIPDIDDIPFPQAAEHPGLYLLFDAPDITGIAMPEEVARVDIAVP